MPHTSRTPRAPRPGRLPRRLVVPASPWRRLVLRTAAVVVPAALVAAGASSYLAVVTGELAADPGRRALTVFAVVTAVAVGFDAVTTLLVQRAAARAETALRAELVTAALSQPLPALEDQGVGELLDRVDDDPATLTSSVAWLGVGAGQAAITAVVSWVVAGVTWWPAWVAFPVVAVVVILLARRAARPLKEVQRETEEAMSDHVSQLEEAVTARDDLRTSLGQAFVLRGYAERAARFLALRDRWSEVFSRVRLRIELPLDALVGAVVVGGMWAVVGGRLDVARLVTVWVLVTGFTGRLETIAGMMPAVEEALGTLQRVRSLREAAREPVGGAPFPGSAGGAGGPGAPRAVDVELRDVTFGYDGGFVLGPLSLRVPAGSTCALVGRTGSGKTTLTKLLSRAVEPPPGTVLLDRVDVRDLDLQDLRRHVGVVGQRTEILAATLLENVTLFAPVPRARVDTALDALGLGGWAASLPDGLDTRLGPAGVTLSAGEEQLVACARLLVRDVSVVVLDEATARMDPATAERVAQATRALLAGRTAVVVAHRLSTVRHADLVAVIDEGRLVEHGPWADLAARDGRFTRLLGAAALDEGPDEAPADVAVGVRSAPSAQPDVTGPGAPGRHPGRSSAGRPSLARAIREVLRARWTWLIGMVVLWGPVGYLATGGLVTGWLWASLVTALDDGRTPWLLAAGIVAAILTNSLLPLLMRRFSARWWAESRARLRLDLLRGQTAQRRRPRDAPGEIVARAQEDGRLLGHSWDWAELAVVPLSVAVLAATTQNALAAALGCAAVAVTFGVAVVGRRAVARSAREAGDSRAELGRLLGSAFDAVRTLKLAAAVPGVLDRVAQVDARRVRAALREDVAKFAVSLSPRVMTQVLTVVAWALHVAGTWPLLTTLVVTTAIGRFGWIGNDLGWMVTQAPVARRWLEIAARVAGTDRLARLPADVDLFGGTATPPAPVRRARAPLASFVLRDVTAVHDDGTPGVTGVDLEVRRGELVLVVGRVGSGKSSLLAGLAGLVDLHGSVTWNGTQVADDEREVFLRPPHVAYVAQVPHVVSGTIEENVRLDHAGRPVTAPVDAAALAPDVVAAGGLTTVVGHRGVRLSGGQAQRLALARALATGSDLLVVDDVSSALDAGTEAQVWAGLRASGATVVGSTSRTATLAAADRVVVLEGGRLVATGPWSGLRGDWGHLAG
ncbi:ABC transporter ATP-binding protein/permease [Antribacter sp. KLBMP9083]|uniref:ABC transporter ATP-binding protein/permease n=1 Tax=Antribacter soli TaxID=2910976 RepID=A0AA41QHM7_9MICO|nr:ABC transporter ATP-binding protein/permease [Antribacter soli]MCF4122841.1 ABC transporter ATP-binding protein/permease [Antribacter soli]